MRCRLAMTVVLLAARGAAAADTLPPALLPDLAHAGGGILDEPARDAGAHPCVADLCQPRVSIPGFDPRPSLSGRRTELAFTYLDRLHLEPFATAAWWLVASGLRFDYRPGAGDVSSGGRPRFEAMLRWRLDAFNRPVRPARNPG